MYTIKTITLCNRGIEKERKIITFTDEKMKIIGEFLMTDAQLSDGIVLEKFQDVLAEKKKKATFSGNRCHVEIKKEKTVVSDLFTHTDEKERYESYTIETETLYDLTKKWLAGKL